MLLKVKIIVIFAFFPYLRAQVLKCIYGDRVVCVSDGFTYFNLCDLEIVRTVHPNLHIRHNGPCNEVKTLDRKIKIISARDDVAPLRRNRNSKKPHHHHTARDDFLFNNIMSQMSQITKLNAFQMTDNAVSTQGENNIFEIDFGSNDSSLRRRMARKFKQRKSKIV
ncbi:uncharacterized protein LOC123690986 [Colias croceus]|uniref:uncharacterized protein LOC123690986 n=1 Tax=Colias crocea TaxID=72248 RepID=UPI001E27A95D|nr:uncharacterized protein LOC123690986 [Colias croceus]